MRMNVAAVAAAMLCFAMEAVAVPCEEDIPAFRPGVDSYRVKGGACGEWSGGLFVVSVQEGRGFAMDYSRYPGMKPFRGVDEIVLATDSDGLGKTMAALTLSEFPHGNKKQKTFYAPLAGETRFSTKLNPEKKYQLETIGIRREQKDDKSWKIGFRSLRGTFAAAKAEALRVEAATGNPLHIVREGQGEKPVLVVRNIASEKIAAHGVLKVNGFFGDTFDLSVDVALDGGETKEIPVCDGMAARPLAAEAVAGRPPCQKKGVWRICGELTADDGSVAKVDTRFAVMDYHAKTPKQPMGTFRLGVLWHLERFTPEDRKLAAAAMVACGAKLTRADMANMASIQHSGPDCWDFARTDELMATLETCGLSLDAIIFNVPKWAAKPENLTNTNWRVWSLGRPVPGTFERFCERLAARYGTRIDYYEIGNEWDFLRCFYGTVDDAADVQREAYAGLKRGCPDVCVLPNGWAAPGTLSAARSGRDIEFQEVFLRRAKDWFDVHPIHCHGAFARYAIQIRDKFFPLRERAGVSSKPWFSNETALTSAWSERNAALAVWKKILWAWANGSVDYIWYNLKGTGWDPKDQEQGYGLITADFFPRDSFVAFSALASVVGGGKFSRTVLDNGSRYAYEFKKGNAIVLAGWDEPKTPSCDAVPVKTDAKRAWLVDLMGNRTLVPVADGRTTLSISCEPSALVLEGATFASADAAALGAGKASSEAPVVIIPPDTPGRKPDFVLNRPEQVHDLFEANPAEVARLWKGPKDNSAKVWLSKDMRGLRIRVDVEDDIHCQPYVGAEQHKGDDIQVSLAGRGGQGRWTFGFAHCGDGRSSVHCRLAPKGCEAEDAAAWIELKTERVGSLTRYDALVPYAESKGHVAKTLEDGIRFNLMINDNDGSGRDATIEIVPNTFHSKDMSLAPVVRFAK